MRQYLIALTVAALAGTVSLLGVAPAAAGKQKPPKAGSVTELAAAVTAAGFGCDDFKVDDPDTNIQLGGLPSGESGGCTIDGEDSELTVYRTTSDLKRVLAAIPSLGCSIGEAFGLTEFRYVVGSNWTISTPSSATTKPLAKAMKAKKLVYECKK